MEPVQPELVPTAGRTVNKPRGNFHGMKPVQPEPQAMFCCGTKAVQVKLVAVWPVLRRERFHRQLYQLTFVAGRRLAQLQVLSLIAATRLKLVLVQHNSLLVPVLPETNATLLRLVLVQHNSLLVQYNSLLVQPNSLLVQHNSLIIPVLPETQATLLRRLPVLRVPETKTTRLLTLMH
jgi:hypothetical protein